MVLQLTPLHQTSDNTQMVQTRRQAAAAQVGKRTLLVVTGEISTILKAIFRQPLFRIAALSTMPPSSTTIVNALSKVKELTAEADLTPGEAAR